MNASLKAALALTCAALAACATPDPPLLPEDAAHLPAVECDTKARCDMLWQRAQLWVVNFAAFKIQISSDVVIQTYNPPAHSVRSGVTITREPLGGERQRINFRSACDNQFGCRPSDTRLRVSFNRYLRETPI